MGVKLTDVAKKAGVSATTVSRVINNYGYLSQKTIDKVHAAMEELNYQPNSMARSLQGKSTQLIGLIFPTVSHPFYGELVAKIETKLFEQGYKTILCDSANNKEKERDYLKMLAANKVDGIIAGAHNLGITEYQGVDLPIISFDRHLADGIPIVSSDSYQGGRLATEQLYQRGGRKIAILTGTNESASPTNRRLEGYQSVIEEHNLQPMIYQFPPDYSPFLKTTEIRQILTRTEIDSIFCTDDLTAILVINTAQELGLKIPDQLKVIGYDGTEFVQNYFPHLSTVLQPIDQFVDLLIDLLMKRVDNADIVLDDLYQLPVKFIQGQTS
ncbi:LacI family DNA-binding transcriptional regulator [Gracilibacillus alcaliphilus]|uniref:LacI family DNA-binding transcriptional regulator n=1 Tax=Gracilibacillus alcaliphilus TaxID=1401441 RepID=UPI0019591131|nr:LacI family DNA-binding transcriptional regulator [Gracilibacillus alcaliphilus]MBM7678018.1 LacI family sucrose operon transcriptional repressor [Gracilibacillus alcaliphilus]